MDASCKMQLRIWSLHTDLPLFSRMKPFNCLQPVLSFSLAASIHWFTQSYCAATNARTTTMLRLLLLYQFWLAEICICHKPRPTRDKMCDPQIAPPRALMLPFFSILLALYTQDTFVLVLNFEVGHFACHFLLLSFFLLVLPWKEFIPHSFGVTFVLPAYTACHSLSLWMTNPGWHNRRQQSVDSAFQFNYIPCSFVFYNRQCYLSQIINPHKSWY